MAPVSLVKMHDLIAYGISDWSVSISDAGNGDTEPELLGPNSEPFACVCESDSK